VARGDGADNSVFHVLNVGTMQVAAEYKGKPNLDLFSQILNDAGKEYGDCLLVVENNGIGISVLEKLRHLQYPNLYYSVKGTHQFIESAVGEHSNNAVMGFTTSTKTRPLIVAKLEEYIRNRLITTHSSRLFHEFKSFIWKNGRAQAQRSSHDDLVMPLAICCWVRDTALAVNQVENEYKKAMILGIKKSTTTFSSAMPGEKPRKEQTFGEKYEKEMSQAREFLGIYRG